MGDYYGQSPRRRGWGGHTVLEQLEGRGHQLISGPLLCAYSMMWRFTRLTAKISLIIMLGYLATLFYHNCENLTTTLTNTTIKNLVLADDTHYDKNDGYILSGDIKTNDLYTLVLNDHSKQVGLATASWVFIGLSWLSSLLIAVMTWRKHSTHEGRHEWLRSNWLAMDIVAASTAYNIVLGTVTWILYLMMDDNKYDADAEITVGRRDEHHKDTSFKAPLIVAMTFTTIYIIYAGLRTWAYWQGAMDGKTAAAEHVANDTIVVHDAHKSSVTAHHVHLGTEWLGEVCTSFIAVLVFGMCYAAATSDHDWTTGDDTVHHYYDIYYNDITIVDPSNNDSIILEDAAGEFKELEVAGGSGDMLAFLRHHYADTWGTAIITLTAIFFVLKVFRTIYTAWDRVTAHAIHYRKCLNGVHTFEDSATAHVGRVLMTAFVHDGVLLVTLFLLSIIFMPAHGLAGAMAGEVVLFLALAAYCISAGVDIFMLFGSNFGGGLSKASSEEIEMPPAYKKH